MIQKPENLSTVDYLPRVCRQREGTNALAAPIWVDIQGMGEKTPVSCHRRGLSDAAEGIV